MIGGANCSLGPGEHRRGPDGRPDGRRRALGVARPVGINRPDHGGDVVTQLRRIQMRGIGIGRYRKAAWYPDAGADHPDQAGTLAADTRVVGRQRLIEAQGEGPGSIRVGRRTLPIPLDMQ